MGANLIRTSVGRNFKGILAQKTIFFKSVRNFGHGRRRMTLFSLNFFLNLPDC